MKLKIVLLIIFLITTFVGQSPGENASGDFWFEVADQGIVNRARFARGGQPIEMGLIAMYMAYFYVVQPNPMIQFPLAFNNQWSEKVFSEIGANWIGKTTLESRTQVVTVPAGTFSNCLKLKTEIRLAAGGPPSDFISGTRYMWFAPGLGLIRVEYHHGNEKVTHILLKESRHVSFFPENYFTLCDFFFFLTVARLQRRKERFLASLRLCVFALKKCQHIFETCLIVEEKCYATGEKIVPWPDLPECLPIFCTNELSSRKAKGWPPKLPVYEAVESRDKLSATWGYIKRTLRYRVW